MARTRFLIIRPLGSSPDLRLNGPVHSAHLSLMAARERLHRMQADCRRYNGPNTWLDRRIVATDDGDISRREISDDEYEASDLDE